MSFRVVPQSLRDFVSTLDGDTSATNTAASYAGAATALEGAEGIFGMVVERHREAITAISAALQHLSTVTSGSAQELNKSADLYEKIDLRHAAQLDAIYPR
jgi:hypothetical protein